MQVAELRDLLRGASQEATADVTFGCYQTEAPMGQQLWNSDPAFGPLTGPHGHGSPLVLQA